MSKIFKCEYCEQVFTRERNLLSHLKIGTEICNKFRQKIKEKDELIQKYESLIKQKEKTHSESLQQMQTVMNELVHVKPTIKARKKFLENAAARNQIQNYETIVSTQKFEINFLRNCLKVGASGDLKIFKNVIVNPKIPKEQHCVKVRDYAREKYQYFDGEEWITTTLQHITEMFMRQLLSHYRIVIQEKHQELDSVDEQYPRWDPEFKQKNMLEFNRVTDKYCNESQHYAQLIACETSLYYQLKAGIKSLLSNANTKNKKSV